MRARDRPREPELLVFALVGCAAGDEAHDSQSLDDVPCAPVEIAAPVHARSLETGLVARIVDRKPGGYLWELDDPTLRCQSALRGGQGTPQGTFDAGFAGCTIRLRATDAQNCTGTRRVQFDFADVGRDHPYHDFVDTTAGTDVRRGCGAANFCPADPTRRKKNGAHPPAVALGDDAASRRRAVPTRAPLFEDVPFTNPYCRWVGQLAQEHIPGGCGPGLYCPRAAVTRGEMAVFLLRAKLGTGFVPPRYDAGTPRRFDDVPAASPLCPRIEERAERQSTGGYAPRL